MAHPVALDPGLVYRLLALLTRLASDLLALRASLVGCLLALIAQVPGFRRLVGLRLWRHVLRLLVEGALGRGRIGVVTGRDKS